MLRTRAFLAFRLKLQSNKTHAYHLKNYFRQKFIQMRQTALLLTLLLTANTLIGQQLQNQKSISPYEWNWGKDGIWTGAALAGSVGGFLLIQNKDGIDMAKLNEELANQDDINFIDRWVVGNDSESASDISDIPFGFSFASPLLLLFNDNINDHTGQVMGLYIESLATTATLYTITAGLVNRSRPYVYSDNIDMDRRLSDSGQRSFYSGHVAASATATFFAAKIFQDFNPDSGAIPYIWTAAALVPAGVGYLRIAAGQHFLTDVLLGYGLGALAGYYIPEWHKVKGETNFSFAPVSGRTFLGDHYQGLSVGYSF